MISTDDGYECFDDDLSDSGSDDDSLGDPEVLRREVIDSSHQELAAVGVNPHPISPDDDQSDEEFYAADMSSRELKKPLQKDIPPITEEGMGPKLQG